MSGRPRWEQASRYYTQSLGAPASIYNSSAAEGDGFDDVTARSRWTAWEHPTGEDAVFVSSPDR